MAAYDARLSGLSMVLTALCALAASLGISKAQISHDLAVIKAEALAAGAA